MRYPATGVIALIMTVGLSGCAGLGAMPDGDPVESPPEVEPRGPEVAVLDPNDFERARQEHRQQLVALSDQLLAADDVGYYMDIQEARLRQKLGSAGVQLVRSDDAIVLTMPGQLTFAADSSTINPGMRSLLDSIAAVLTEYDKTLVSLYGHTDASGPADYNQRLSELRALALASYFVERGVDNRRLVIIGRGEAAPIADNGTEQGRRLNRRVELRIEPIHG